MNLIFLFFFSSFNCSLTYWTARSWAIDISDRKLQCTMTEAHTKPQNRVRVPCLRACAYVQCPCFQDDGWYFGPLYRCGLIWRCHLVSMESFRYTTAAPVCVWCVSNSFSRRTFTQKQKELLPGSAIESIYALEREEECVSVQERERTIKSRKASGQELSFIVVAMREKVTQSFCGWNVWRIQAIEEIGWFFIFSYPICDKNDAQLCFMKPIHQRAYFHLVHFPSHWCAFHYFLSSSSRWLHIDLVYLFFFHFRWVNHSERNVLLRSSFWIL